MSLPTI